MYTSSYDKYKQDNIPCGNFIGRGVVSDTELTADFDPELYQELKEDILDNNGNSSVEQSLASLRRQGFEFIVVAAAGNTTSDARTARTVCSDRGPMDDISLCVANVGKSVINNEVGRIEFRLSDFSSFGQVVDIAASGVGIYVPESNGFYTETDGTSFSAPIVSAAVGLVWNAFPELSAVEVRQIIIDSSQYDAVSDKTQHPIPVLNVDRAIRLARIRWLDNYGAMISNIDYDPTVNVDESFFVTVQGFNIEDLTLVSELPESVNCSRVSFNISEQNSETLVLLCTHELSNGDSIRLSVFDDNANNLLEEYIIVNVTEPLSDIIITDITLPERVESFTHLQYSLARQNLDAILINAYPDRLS